MDQIMYEKVIAKCANLIYEENEKLEVNREMKVGGCA